MRPNNIDDLFNSGLKDQHFEIKDAYLNDLENRLKKKKKKPVFFWFYSLVGGLIVFLGVNYMFFNSDVNLNLHTDKIVENLEKIRILETGIQNAQFENKHDNLDISNGSIINGAIDEETNANKQNAELNYSSDKTAIPLTNARELNLEYLNNEKINSNIQTRANITNTIINLADAEDGEKKNALVDHDSQKYEDNTLIEDIVKSSSIADIEDLEVNEIDSTSYDEQNTDSNKNSALALEINRNVNLLLSLEAGINRNSAKYEGLESEFYRNNNSEKLTMNYEFNANVLIKNKFIFGTGIGLREQKYDYNYNTSSMSYDTTQITDSVYILDFYLYQQGIIYDSVYHYDYNTVTTIDSTLIDKNYQNVTQAKYITIPLNIGYSFTHKKLMIGLYVTTRLNILQNARGGYYSNNSFETFETSNNQLFKKSYVSFSFKTNIAYNLYKNIYVHGSFEYSPYFKSVIDIPILKKKVQLVNGSLGITYKL